MMIYTNSRSKTKKKNPTAKERQLMAEWNEIVMKHTKPISQLKSHQQKVKPYKLVPPPGREPKCHYPSVESSYCHTYKKQSTQYTGTNMIGIATMHKSNAIPVFAQEQAVEISQMRRG